MEIINLGQADGLPPVEWAAVADKLDAGSAPAPDAMNARTTWLSTINQDGSPHVTAVGALWLEGGGGLTPITSEYGRRRPAIDACTARPQRTGR